MAEKRLLRRSRNKVVAGVCSGLAERIGVSVSLMRLMYMFGTVASFVLPGLILYLLFYLLMRPPLDEGGS